jgi:poly(A) polymerase
VRAYRQHPAAPGAEVQSLLAACEQVTLRQVSRVSVPKRFTQPLREIIGLQPRFDKRDGRRALRLMSHPRFRAAYDFLLLRAASGEIPQEVADWWTEIQTLTPEERVKKVESAQKPADEPQVRRRRRRRRRARGAQSNTHA